MHHSLLIGCGLKGYFHGRRLIIAVEEELSHIKWHKHQVAVVVALLYLIHCCHKHRVGTECTHGICEIHRTTALRGEKPHLTYETGAGTKLQSGTDAQHAIARHAVVEHKLAFENGGGDIGERIIALRDALHPHRHLVVAKKCETVVFDGGKSNFHTIDAAHHRNQAVGMLYHLAFGG